MGVAAGRGRYRRCGLRVPALPGTYEMGRLSAGLGLRLNGFRGRVRRENLPIGGKLENWRSAILRFDFRLSVPQFFSCAVGHGPNRIKRMTCLVFLRETDVSRARRLGGR